MSVVLSQEPILESGSSDIGSLVDVSLMDTLERDVHYVTGRLKASDHEVVLTLAPTAMGWRCRSMYGNTLRHDYVCHESLHKVTSWLWCDLKRGSMYVSTDRAGTLAYLATLLEKPEVLARPSLVAGPPCLPATAAAGVVLRHLERGC